MIPLDDNQIYVASAFAGLQRGESAATIRAGLIRRFSIRSEGLLNEIIERAMTAQDIAGQLPNAGQNVTLAELGYGLDRAAGPMYAKVQVESNIAVPADRRALGETNILTIHVPITTGMTVEDVDRLAAEAAREAIGDSTTMFRGELATVTVVGVF